MGFTTCAGQDLPIEVPIEAPQSDTWTQKAPGKRKCTYAARRMQTKELQAEVRRLESAVAVLRARNSPTEDSLNMDPVQRAAAETAQLTEASRSQQLHVAQAQSLLSRCLQSHHPLYTHIRLSKDWSQRRHTLMAMREKKLQTAYDFTMAPSRQDEPQKFQFSDARFETAQGDYCGTRLGSVQFPGIHSVQQVYDAILFYFSNHEISLSERLGHISVRDDYDVVDGSVYNYRVISTTDRGVVTEISTLLFPRLSSDGACGMVVVDTIDEDELYPYTPSERVRKDISATAVITLSPNKDGEMVATIRQAAFLKIHRPECAISEIAQRELYDGILSWGDVMLKTVRSIVYATH